MGRKDDERNVWENPLIFDVVAEKWPFLFQLFPSKNRSFDFEKIEFPEKISLRVCACPPPTAPRIGLGSLIWC